MQPDFILGREDSVRYFQKVSFQMPLVHDSDHLAIVATFHLRRTQRLQIYWQKHLRLPLQFPPEPHDNLTWDFEALKQPCKKADPKSRKGNEWISDTTWALISNCSMLRRTGQLCHTTGRRMQWQIYATLKLDQEARTAKVGTSIERKLARGGVRDAFCHLKGWYWAAAETMPCPCPQTMKR
jgi:hypothetical protein